MRNSFGITKMSSVITAKCLQGVIKNQIVLQALIVSETGIGNLMNKMMKTGVKFLCGSAKYV